MAQGRLLPGVLERPVWIKGLVGFRQGHLPGKDNDTGILQDLAQMRHAP